MMVVSLNYYKKCLLMLLYIFALSGCLSKPEPPSGDFNGKVIDSYTKEPVPEVAVTLNGNRVVTDIQGRFAIDLLPPGEYDISMSRDWYYPKTEHLRHVGRTDLWTFELTSEPINGKILYSGDRDKNWEIYELNLMDRSVARLTYLSNSSETNPVKLPDRVMFQTDCNGYDEIFNYDFINNPIKFTCGSLRKMEHPSVDSFGSKIVFKTGDFSPGQICFNVMNNAQFIKISSGYNPVINPEGTKIAIVNGTYEKLLIYDVSGMSITKEFNFYSAPQKLRINNPCWRPGSNLIALEAYQDSGGPRSIYIINVDSDTASLQPITFSQRYNEQHHHPCWSSRGGLLFFSGNIVYSSREDIYCVKYDNSDGIFETVKNNASWLMVSSGSGDKKYPSWGGESTAENIPK